jgi:outer membrane protein assembly factor BamB
MEDGGGMYGSAFSSPVIATLSGTRQLVVQTREKLGGIDLETGRVLWQQKIEAFRGMNILTPIVQGDRIFTSSYGGKAQGWQISRDGDTWKIAEIWQAKLQAYMSTPVVIDGHAYTHLRNQRIACVKIEDGTVPWISPTPATKYWSMVWQDKRILALDDRGTLHLMDANPEKFDVIDTLKVSDTPDTWAHLTPAGHQLFVRAIDKIIAYRWKK